MRLDLATSVHELLSLCEGIEQGEALAQPIRHPENVPHLIARPFRKDLLCILKPLHLDIALDGYMDDDLFALYKKDIKAGIIQYDKSRGYLGNGCEKEKVSEPKQTQTEIPPTRSGWDKLVDLLTCSFKDNNLTADKRGSARVSCINRVK